jgi:LuxR family transcriptional regulator, maltose regulon positive regulatory protein
LRSCRSLAVHLCCQHARRAGLHHRLFEGDPKFGADVARALEVHGHTIAEYFIAVALDQQPPEVARFMLDTSILSVLTAGACAAVTGRADAAALLHGIDGAHLFLVALDEERTSFRYHSLVRQMLHAELRARDQAREHMLQLRAFEWRESAGDTRHAARHFLAARQADRAPGSPTGPAGASSTPSSPPHRR